RRRGCRRRRGDLPVARGDEQQRSADGDHERGGERERVEIPSRRRGRRRLLNPSFLAQPPRDLQPDAFGGLQLVERRGRVADLLQIGEGRAAVLARLEVLLDLGATDRSDRAVGQLLKRRDVTGARHVRLSFRLKAEATKLYLEATSST